MSGVDATAAAPRGLALVGAGRVARALGRNAAGRGLEVRYWVRDPARAESLGAAPATALSDVVPTPVVAVLAVPFAAVAEVVPRLPLAAGSVLVDATNPFGAPVPDGAGSGAAWVAAHAAPGVAVVKAFNVLGAESMAEPGLPAPVLPVAGDDEGARARVAALARLLGFDAVEVGDLAAAATMEEAVRYWGLLALSGGLGRDVVLVARRGGARGA